MIFLVVAAFVLGFMIAAEIGRNIYNRKMIEIHNAALNLSGQLEGLDCGCIYSDKKINVCALHAPPEVINELIKYYDAKKV